MKFNFYRLMNEAGSADGGGGPVTQTPAEKAEADLFQQMPKDGQEMDLSKSSTEVTLDPNANLEPVSIHQGFTGEIKTQEEFVNYTKSLEDQITQNRAAAMATETEKNNSIPKASSLFDDMTIETNPTDADADRIFSDPKGVMKEYGDNIVKQLDIRDNLNSQRKVFWNDFYQTNPELKKNSRMVESVFQEQMPVLKSLSIAESAKILASKTKEWLNQINVNAGNSEILPGKSAHVMQTTQVAAPKAQVERAPGPTNFAEELSNYQNSKH